MGMKRNIAGMQVAAAVRRDELAIEGDLTM
jgi:hypothetical protein